MAVEITEKSTKFVQVNITYLFCASESNGEAFQPRRPKVNGLEQKVVTWEKNRYL